MLIFTTKLLAFLVVLLCCTFFVTPDVRMKKMEKLFTVRGVQSGLFMAEKKELNEKNVSEVQFFLNSKADSIFLSGLDVCAKVQNSREAVTFTSEDLG